MTATKMPDNFRCGYIAIVGRPNVGKSTLMNVLIGAKVSITSRKAQTTRHRITGIQTVPDAQFIYVDTPGFQTRHSNALNKTLNKTVTNTLISSDVILYVIEAGTFGPADQQVMDLLPKEVPCILVINKSDRVKDKAVLLPFAQKIAAMRDFAAIVPVSAKLHFQLEGLQNEIKRFLSVGGDADDVETVLHFEKAAHAVPEYRMIVRDDDPNVILHRHPPSVTGFGA